MDAPHYSYPPGLLIRVSWDASLLRRRNFREDARACIANLKPPLQVWGEENIPQHGRCVLTVNHYHRPGFKAQWLTLAVSAMVPSHVLWVITGEFTDWGKSLGAIGTLGSRILLRRIAYMYGFITMPPMPPRPNDMEARAASVRAVLEYVRGAKDPVLGLAPEGCDSPNGVLARTATGLGRFGLLLSKAGMKFIPIGAYEAEGMFHLHFGERYELQVGSHLSADEKDEQAAQIIMKRIACLLPPYLRGDFA